MKFTLFAAAIFAGIFGVAAAQSPAPTEEQKQQAITQLTRAMAYTGQCDAVELNKLTVATFAVVFDLDIKMSGLGSEIVKNALALEDTSPFNLPQRDVCDLAIFEFGQNGARVPGLLRVKQ